MKDPGAKVIAITAAPGLAPEEVSRREALVAEAERLASAHREAEAARTLAERERDDLVALADGLLYTVAAASREYLLGSYVELTEAVARLEEARKALDPHRLRAAILALEQVIAHLFPPGGPDGPVAAQASLGPKGSA